jgi:hypothetical protein
LSLSWSMFDLTAIYCSHADFNDSISHMCA